MTEVLSIDIQQKLRQAIIDSVTKSHEEDFQVVTDVHMHVDTDTGVLSFYNDDEAETANICIEDWIDIDGDEYITYIVAPLRELLNQMYSEKCFENISIAKPFAFVLEDNDKETIEELLIVDDDNIIITTELLKGLDDELDTFFENLMKD